MSVAVLLGLFRRRYLNNLRAAIRQRRLKGLVQSYAAARSRLSEYAKQRGGPVVEKITFRQMSYGIRFEDIQMAFASQILRQVAPETVYDIGSHRGWILGIGAHYPVVSLDVREPAIRMDSETFSIGKAEHLPWADASVDFLVSLHSIEHFGLGAYGDPPDTWADHKAATEIARVVRPGGHLVLTTTVTGGETYTVYDAHRVYAREELHRMLADFDIVEERLFSRERQSIVTPAELGRQRGGDVWDLYLVHAVRRAT